jgi:hypothetical protein
MIMIVSRNGVRMTLIPGTIVPTLLPSGEGRRRKEISIKV